MEQYKLLYLGTLLTTKKKNFLHFQTESICWQQINCVSHGEILPQTGQKLWEKG